MSINMFEQDDVTPTGEIEKLIKTLRNYFIEGQYKEGCGIGITFLSGLSVGLKLKEKENEKLNLQ